METPPTPDSLMEDLAVQCDQRGLPHNLESLLRHESNNGTAVINAKDSTIDTLTEQRDELYDALDGLLSRLADVVGVDSTHPAEGEASRLCVQLKRARETSNFDPDWIISPGATLQDWLEEDGLDITSAADLCELEVEEFQELLEGRLAISPAIAKGLSKACGSTPQFWLNREADYQVGLAAGKTDTADRDGREAQMAMRLGPRSYTPEQTAVINEAVRSRRPLKVPPLPMEGESPKDLHAFVAQKVASP
jgi:plasmid maintenance system antidote protein VapI